MKKTLFNFALIASLVPSFAFAETAAVQGDEAVKLLNEDKGKAQVLAQRDKLFVLVAPDGTETLKPKEIKLKVGERFYITNEEEKYVHNVYDDTDHSWVLKKQSPGGIAAITFDEAGKRKLRCAIHPKMKIKVIVE